MNWYKKNKNRKPSDYNSKQMELGKEIEKEHTDNEEIAEEIAMDHLDEFPNYYTELEKMEKDLEKD